MPIHLDAATSALVDQVRQLAPDKAFRAFADLLQQSPGNAHIAALGLREKARAGELGEECIPVLDSCLADAPDPSSVVHLAKALAAFGRKAQSAAPTLVERMRELHVTDDVSYWILDGCLFALGFLGGDVAAAFVDGLARERPNRAVRSNSVYEGDMTRDERNKRFVEAVTRVRALLEQKNPGQWREKKTDLVPKPEQPKGPSKKSWMVR